MMQPLAGKRGLIMGVANDRSIAWGIAQALARGVPVDNDIGLFFRSFATADWGQFDRAPQVIAVTGSNGKSTTTALIDHILRAAGRAVRMAGNIGTGVLSLPPAQDGAVVVLELSSYQTDLARALTPDVAVLTNISPDHLDRHGGLGGYFAAKRRLFAEGGPDRAIIGVDEDEGLFLADQLGEGPGDDRVIRISSGQKLSGPGWSVFARKGFLAEWRKGRQLASVDLRAMKGLAGAHNHQNACAAWAVARTLGLAGVLAAMALLLTTVTSRDEIAEAVAAHRLEFGEESVPLRKAERLNILLIAVLVTMMQFALVALLVFVFFVLFGALTLPDATAQSWMNEPPKRFTGILSALAVSTVLVKVCAVLAAFSALNFVATASGDRVYRDTFVEPTLRDLRGGLLVREAYLNSSRPRARKSDPTDT